jgi:hypothetical protein
MAKKTTPKAELSLGGGEIRTRDDGSQYVWDPGSKKGYSIETSQGQFLLGKDPSKAKKHGGNDRALIDSFKGATAGGSPTAARMATGAPKLSPETQQQVSSLDKQIDMLTKAAQGEGLDSFRNQTIKKKKKEREQLLAGFGPDGKRAAPATMPTDIKTKTKDGTVTTVPKTGEAPETDIVVPPNDAEGIDSSAFDAKKDEFLATLGEKGAEIGTVISNFETAQGKSVDIANEDLQTRLKEAAEQGASEEEVQAILSEYPLGGKEVPYEMSKVEDLPEDMAKLEQNIIDAGSMDPGTLASAQDAYSKGYLNDEEYKAYLEKNQPTAADKVIEEVQYPEFKYEEPAEVTIANTLSTTGSLDFAGISSLISSLSSDKPVSEMSSAELNQLMLAQMQLSSTSEFQTKLTTLYSNMKDRAQDAYDSAKDDVDVATVEIDNILSGKDSTATTLESLMVRVATQNKDVGMMSLEATEASMNAEFEFTFNKMLEQNSRLEGYMKAKLNWMGAADSSSGLTTLAMAVDNAQQTLLLYQGKHSADMLQLEAQKTQMLNGFYNSVTEQLIGLRDKEGSALGTYNDKLDEIEGNELASNQEAQTMQLNVLSGLITNLHSLDQEQKTWEYNMAQDAYDKAWKEMEWVHGIENEAKGQAASNLDMLSQAYNGMSFDQIDPEAQKAMVDMAKLLGLPESFPREMLNAQIRELSGSGGGSGSGGAGGSQYAAYASYAAGAAEAAGMGLKDWLDLNTSFDSGSKDLIQQAYTDSQIEGTLAQAEQTEAALGALGLTFEDLAAAGQSNAEKKKANSWKFLYNVVTGGGSSPNMINVMQ